MFTTLLTLYLALTAGYSLAHLDVLRRPGGLPLLLWIALRWPVHVLTDLKRSPINQKQP